MSRTRAQEGWATAEGVSMMKKATELRGIPQILKRTPPEANQQWRIAARVNTIRHLLIREGVVSKEEFTEIEDKILGSMDEMRADAIRKTTFPTDK